PPPRDGIDGSVALAVDQLVGRDPRHHGPQPLAHFLDRVRIVHAANALEAGRAGTVFLHPLGGELAGLDVIQDPLHLGLGLGGDDARTGYVLAPLGGVGDRVVHVGDAALIDQ